MKSNLKYLLFGLLTAGTFSGCINDDSYPNIDSECFTLTPTKTVADIYAMAPPASTTEGTPILYTGADIIEAYVTSSDAGGTFYKSISFQTLDGSRAFSIPVDMYNIYNSLEPGRKVYVNLEGKYFNQTYGSLIIGDLYQDISIGRLVRAEFERTVKPSCETVDEDVLVQHLTIEQAKTDANVNKLIEFDMVQFRDDALNTTYYNPANTIGGATNIYLVDADGKSIIFRTSEFAKFAGKQVPSGRGKVRGVLTKYQGDYQFLARTEDDIQLTGPRLVPLFEETFSTNFPLWTKFSVTGSQNWTLDTTHGNPGSCAKMSGFASGNNANEDWLISPAINASALSTATLSFDTATDFNGNVLQVYISTNYTGTGSPAAATWTAVSGNIAPTDSNYAWTPSGAINISAYVGGNIHIAYKYTSTTSASATWEVDNVKVTGN
jgi:hypothetical protein